MTMAIINPDKLCELHALVTEALLKEASGELTGVAPFMIKAARRFLVQNGIRVEKLSIIHDAAASPKVTPSEETITTTRAIDWKKAEMLHPLKL
jgi:hypothetical protein